MESLEKSFQSFLEFCKGKETALETKGLLLSSPNLENHSHLSWKLRGHLKREAIKVFVFRGKHFSKQQSCPMGTSKMQV